MSIVSIKDAVATLQCGKEYEAKLTLVPAPPAPPVAPADVHEQVTLCSQIMVKAVHKYLYSSCKFFQ